MNSPATSPIKTESINRLMAIDHSARLYIFPPFLVAALLGFSLGWLTFFNFCLVFALL